MLFLLLSILLCVYLWSSFPLNDVKGIFSYRANFTFNIYFFLLNRFMEMRNGLLGTVNKVLECLAVHRQRIQCIHIVNALNLGKHPSQSTRLIRSWGNLVENGMDTRMICYQRIAIISVMCFVNVLACQSFLVIGVLFHMDNIHLSAFFSLYMFQQMFIYWSSIHHDSL